MDMDKAWRLQKEWQAKGNPPCDHPDYEMERFQPGGMHTGDHVCTQCGAVVDPADLRSKRQQPSQD
jgi:hypothetical protein